MIAIFFKKKQPTRLFLQVVIFILNYLVELFESTIKQLTATPKNNNDNNSSAFNEVIKITKNVQKRKKVPT